LKSLYYDARSEKHQIMLCESLRVRSLMGAWGFFADLILKAPLWPLTEMSSCVIPWGRGADGQSVGITPLPRSCADCLYLSYSLLPFAFRSHVILSATSLSFFFREIG